MQLNGLLHGARLLSHVDFPTPEVLGPDAGEDAIQGLIDRHGLVFVRPVFRGGVGKKGKAGLVDYNVVRQGPEAIKARFAQLKADGCNFAVPDALTNDDLQAIGAAWEVVQLQASRSQPILDMHRMAAQNPVWIVTASKENL